MLDCGLDINSALHFLPLPLVSSKRLAGLPTWVPRDTSEAIQLDGVSSIMVHFYLLLMLLYILKELKECDNQVFVDSSIELLPPQTNIFDISTVDTILLSNHSCMLALPFITEETGFKGLVYATEPTLQIGR